MNRFTSLEPEDRRVLLGELGAKYGLDVFIETGTNQGLTPLALKDSFGQLYTIELDPTLHQRAQRMFRGITNVECLQGDSTDVLPAVLDKIDGPALVWLDGHYSGPGTAHGAESTPVREELAILFGDGRPHIILVDDARIFDGGPEHELYPHYATYPPLKWVADYAFEHDYDYELRDDIIRLVPHATG